MGLISSGDQTKKHFLRPLPNQIPIQLDPPHPEMDPTLPELPFANVDEVDEPSQGFHMVPCSPYCGRPPCSLLTLPPIVHQSQGTDDREGSTDGGGDLEEAIDAVPFHVVLAVSKGVPTR